MKRKTSLSLLKSHGSVHNCIVTPHIISNVVFISNIILPKMEKDCVVVDGSAISSINFDSDELIISHFVQKIKIGKAMVGAS